MALKVRNIKVELAKRGKTGRQVAAEVGLSPASFSRLIHGHRHADAHLLERIEQAIKGQPASPNTTAAANQPPSAD